MDSSNSTGTPATYTAVTSGLPQIGPALRCEAAIAVPGCDMVSILVIRPDTLVLLSSVVVLKLITLLLGWFVDFSLIVELSG